MTTAKKMQSRPFTRLELAQYRLRRIAKALESGETLPSGELKFLVKGLKCIGNGEDASAALEVKAKRGERKTRKQAEMHDRIFLALSWIAAAVRSKEEGGLGMKLDDAIATAGKRRGAGFGLTEDTLKTYWHNNPDLHSPSFNRPIWTFPDETPKPRK
jgi:hypothetical protein